MKPQKIDDFFKDKFEQRSFEMKEEYWKNAEQMIEEDRRRRRFGFFRFWVLLALVMLGVLGTWFFFSPNPGKEQLSEKTLDQTVAVEPSPSSPEKQEKQNTYRPDDSSENESSENNTHPNKSKTQTSSTTKNKQETNISKQESIKYSSSAAAPHAPSQEDAGDAVLPESDKTDAAPNGNEPSKNAQVQAEEIAITTKRRSEKQPSTTGASIPPVMEEEAAKSETINPNSQNNKAIDSSKKGEGAIAIAPDKTPSTRPIAKRLLVPIDLPLVPSLLDNEDRLLSLDEDRELAPLSEGADQPALKSLIKHWSLGLATGMDMLPQTNNGQVDLGYRLGLSLRYKLNAKWALQTAMLFTSRSSDFNTNLDSVVQVDYSFGRSERILQFEGNRIYTFEWPLTLQFGHRRHLLEGGPQFNYLLGVQADVLEDRFLLPWERTELSNAYARSVLDPVELSGTEFKQFYLALQLAYHYQLTPRWQIGLQARWVPGSDNIEARANHFRLGMRYYFLKW
ncbi:MAG: hypothetical protein AAF985_02720 [Bacteroidota bacterium]